MKLRHGLQVLTPLVVLALPQDAWAVARWQQPSGPSGGDSACPPIWNPTLGDSMGTARRVLCMQVFDSGAGPELYVGGSEVNAVGGLVTGALAKWDGSDWIDVGGLSTEVPRAMVVHDDGNGPALYIGGRLNATGGLNVDGVARWDGTTMVPVGGVFRDGVYALAVHDDGNGPALYAGGYLATVDGAVVRGVARWDGSTWSQVGSGLFGLVRKLTSLDDGSGEFLYACGNFKLSGSTEQYAVARWDGSSWSALGASTSLDACDLTIFDDGTGAALWVGGLVNSSSGPSGTKVLRWDGVKWSAPPGMPVTASSDQVFALETFDDGSGEALYVGGNFEHSGVAYLFKWTASGWETVGSGVHGIVDTLVALDVGAGVALYAGGKFVDLGEQGVQNLGWWNGQTWSTTGEGLDASVDSMAVHDSGSGPELHMGGRFVRQGDKVLRRVARWTGSTLEPLGSGMGGGWGETSVRALASFDDGQGARLYAGGDFSDAGGVAAAGIARWDGSVWSSVGTGANAPVRSLATWDDGSEVALYAGGEFTTVGGVAAKGIARWDGAAWQSVGGGVDGGPVLALCVHDDGGGPDLYVAGDFLSAGGVPMSRIARWDGSAWSAVGEGFVDTVHTLKVFDAGQGPRLYAGGAFSHSGSKFVGCVARLEFFGWSGTHPPAEWILALEVFDDGSGPRLYAGGQLTYFPGKTKGVVRWEDSPPIWSELGEGVFDRVHSLKSFDDGSGTKLFVGGEFFANEVRDGHLSRWGCPDVDVGNSYCTAGTTTTGCVPVVHATGFPSATNGGGFRVDVSQLESEQIGLLMYSVSGPASLPWASGSSSLLCLAPPVQRMSVQPTGGIVTTCLGSLFEDWSAFVSLNPDALGTPFQGGESVWIQGWFRDPPAPGGTNLSNGLQFTVLP